MIFENKYLIKFDKKYKKDNFYVDKELFFFLGKPMKQDIKMINVCASCTLNKDDIGVFIKKFKINNSPKGIKLEMLLKKENINISIYKNIIKKGDIYYITSSFIEALPTKKDKKINFH